ncbi:MAG: hypothetical protein ABJL99_03200 [Aliishimia sp.]
MHLILHTGAHFTEEERLMKCLLRNKGDFANRGVAVPGPGQYRRLLRDTLQAMRGHTASPEARDILLDDILDGDQPDRLILSNAHFFGAPRACVRAGVLYPNAGERLAQFTQLFPNDQIELFLALRNPATFLPAVFDKSPKEEMQDFLGNVDPCTIRWSMTLAHLQAVAPSVQFTVWCNEDAPLIWAQIIREMANLKDGEKIAGGFDLLSAIMSQEGMARFRAYLKTHPVMTEQQKRRVIAAFLDKFALDEAIEEELDLPGWTDELVDEMTDVYDEDVMRIQQMPGVRMLLP